MIKIGQSAAKPKNRKVQRLSYKRVRPSGRKWGASYKLRRRYSLIYIEIYSSESGQELANLVEDNWTSAGQKNSFARRINDDRRSKTA